MALTIFWQNTCLLWLIPSVFIHQFSSLLFILFNNSKCMKLHDSWNEFNHIINLSAVFFFAFFIYKFPFVLLFPKCSLSLEMALLVSTETFQHHLTLTAFWIMLISVFPSIFAGIAGQKVRVEEELEAYPTESVDLRCQFVDGGGRTKLTQVRRQCFITVSLRNVRPCFYWLDIFTGIIFWSFGNKEPFCDEGELRIPLGLLLLKLHENSGYFSSTCTQVHK